MQQQKFQSYKWGLSPKWSQTTSQLDKYSICNIWIICNSVTKCHHFIPEPITMDWKTITVLFKRTNDEITAETRRKDKRLLPEFVLRTYIQLWKLKNSSNHSSYNCWITSITNSNYDLLTSLCISQFQAPTSPQATPGFCTLLLPRGRELYLMTFPRHRVFAYP